MDKMKQEEIAEMERAIAADYANIAGMVVLKNGERVYENYFGGCTADSRIHVFSVTKSVVSILLGIALDKGYIGGIDQRVLDFYPKYTPKRGEKTLQNITLRDMLTMTAPYKYKATPLYEVFHERGLGEVFSRCARRERADRPVPVCAAHRAGRLGRHTNKSDRAVRSLFPDAGLFRYDPAA